MSKGHEDHRNGHKKKAKFTLKEKRQQKREKKQKNLNTPHTEEIL